ncbi:uncharacterized protein RAG0_08240 [Rhynchosporium agropyri]|uniref:Uncharacterized protein n=1 Tax=Rhynchosporium agropyri TaxID=914238 RepID=A0A1E1KQ00_9HELO|nr:uncharacterized protein RAG0_08240 [Rhynchosporium agropyri]
MQLSFPHLSPFPELIQRAQRDPSKIVLRDHSTGKTATAGKLLQSVSLIRADIQAALGGNDTECAQKYKNDRFIFLLAPPGLEYVAAMLAIISLGAGMSAQSLVIRPEEMARFIKIAKPLALLYTSDLTEKVNAIKSISTEMESASEPMIPFLEIRIDHSVYPMSHHYVMKQNIGSASDLIGTLFFTSGTSGSPKGVIHSYTAILASARERIESWSLTEHDMVLCQKPGNWMGGIFGILPSLIAGACLETCAAVFDSKWFWERIRQGGLSIFSIAPEGYDRFAEYYDENIATLPAEQKDSYIAGITAVKVAGATGSRLLPQTQHRWTELRRGKPLLNLYGSTEATLICGMNWKNPDYLDMCSVGPPVPGVEVKIVGGEMRLKAPTMFSRYLSDDPTQTEKAFDSEGFFRTGDCAEELGGCYILHGRANIDVMHFWGFTLHTSEIESALTSLPYIADAIVLPIDDEECQQRAAAIIRLQPSCESKFPQLKELRNDLTQSTGLMQFKQPTVVYWLRESEEISLTANGKVSKKMTKSKLFVNGWQSEKNVEVLDLKEMEYWRMGGQC